MGQVLHGSARTTAAVRRAIQRSEESLRALAKCHGINQKTVAKWKKRTSAADQRTGPKAPHSTVLSTEDEAVVVAFRRHTLLPLDDCLYALQATIPHLTRSSLHRCLQRHGISRLPDTDGGKPRRAKFKRYPISYFHIDIAEVRSEQGLLYLLVAIDRTSKFVFVELHEKATRRVAGDFLRHLAAAVPYKITTVLTDNETHFTEPTGDGWTPEDTRAMRTEKVPFRCHSFELACADLDIEHRLTKPRHPWTNGQVERMNRTIKDATVKRFHYDSHDQLRQHLADFVAAHNFARRFKTLCGLTPCTSIRSMTWIGKSLVQHDPKHNLLLSVHAYWATLQYDGFAEIDTAVQNGLPLVFGEIANKQYANNDECYYGIDGTNLNNAPTYLTPSGSLFKYQALLPRLAQAEIGWLAWSWGPDSCPERRMSTDGTFANLTPFGTDIVMNGSYGLKNGFFGAKKAVL